MNKHNVVDEEISFFDLIEVCMKGKKVIILSVLITALIGWSISNFLVTKNYISTATVVIDKVVSINTVSSTESTELGINNLLEGTKANEPQSLESYLEQMMTNDMLDRVINELNLNDKYMADDLRSMITLTNKSNSNLINIEVETDDPNLSAQIANVLAIEFEKQVESKDLNLMKSSLMATNERLLIRLTSEINTTNSKIDGIQSLMDETEQFFVDMRETVKAKLSEVNLNTSDLVDIADKSIVVNPNYLALENDLNDEQVKLSLLLQSKSNVTDAYVNLIEMIDKELRDLELKSVDNYETSSTSILFGITRSNIILESQSVVPTSPTGTSDVINAIVAGVVGFGLAVFFLIIRYFIHFTKRERFETDKA